MPAVMFLGSCTIWKGFTCKCIGCTAGAAGRGRCGERYSQLQQGSQAARALHSMPAFSLPACAVPFECPTTLHL